MDVFNHQKMCSIKGFDNYDLYGVIPSEEMDEAPHYDLPRIYERITKALDRFEKPVDATVSYIDLDLLDHSALL